MNDGFFNLSKRTAIREVKSFAQQYYYLDFKLKTSNALQAVRS